MGAASSTDIANQALMRLGQRTIQSLNEVSNEATWCNKAYDTVRKTVLRSFPWRFALKVETLAVLEAVTPEKYIYAFQLPSDCLAIIEVFSDSTADQIEFERHGDQIWTDVEDARLRYIQNVTDTSKFDDIFVDAFADRLGADVAMAITGKPELASMMMQRFSSSLMMAREISAREARKPAPGTSNRIKDSRA